MQRLVIGTAGHIDHGKSTLVKKLTGIEPDRLKEEKQRGISIELGFAPFVLPSGLKAALVDVPGHERFIRHMLAGAFGIDMVLFTIAADEGIMPQTREHGDIIELLGVNKGVIVVTKKDLVDEEWLLLVEDEIKNYIDGTVLKGAPIVAVSAVTGEGIPELLETIEQVATSVQEKPVTGKARLPIDRVFTIAGFGTVVTGTLWSGQIAVGDTLELMPVQRTVKVRALQVHNERVNIALAGQRIAVNLQGVEVGGIKRGYLLAEPGFLSPSYRVDVRLRLLEGSTRTLHNWNRLRFHLGTDEALGRVVLLDRHELGPGEEAYAQIVMEKPVVAFKGDRFVIRYYSPVDTIGGGIIIDPNAPKQKRFNEEVLNDLAVKEEGSLYELVLHELESPPQPLGLNDLARRTGNIESAILMEIQQLLDDEAIINLEAKGGLYLSTQGMELLYQQMAGHIGNYSRKYPLRSGCPKEEMRTRLFANYPPKIFNALLKHLEETEYLVIKNNLVSLPGWQVVPGDKENKAISSIMRLMQEKPFSPPDLPGLGVTAGITDMELDEVLAYLVDQGRMVKISEGLYFTRDAIEKGRQMLNQHFEQEQELTLSTVRDILNTSRKYALPLIEYYDKIRFTRRVGDVRVRYNPTPEKKEEGGA